MEILGYIYKIINLQNNKIYIGQTQQDYRVRFAQHISHAKTGHSNHKLARAIRKYGKDSFVVEVLEEVPFEKLDEREIYWIKYYDSTNDKIGYNITLGGQGERRISLPSNIDEILEYYYNCHNQVETYQHFGLTDYKFRQLLMLTNSPLDKSRYGQHTKTPVKIVELDLTFESQKECAQYFIDNNICKSKRLDCVCVRVNAAIRENKKVYGYTIQKIDK